MGNLFSRLKAITSWATTAWKILALIGWQAPVAGLILSASGWFWAHLQRVPTSIAVMASIPVFVSILYLWRIPRFIAGANEISGLTRPDYGIWAHLDRYTVGSAAYLMGGVHPIDNPAFMPGNTGVFYQIFASSN